LCCCSCCGEKSEPFEAINDESDEEDEGGDERENSDQRLIGYNPPALLENQKTTNPNVTARQSTTSHVSNRQFDMV